MAIAFDAASNGAQGTGTSHTWSHTCTGENRFLVVWGHQINTASVTVTYAGVTMSHIGTVGTVDLWYLASPASGANNVIASWSGSQYMRFCSVSYSGVDPIASINISGTYSAGGVSSYTGTVTTTKDNCWLVIGATGGSTLTAGTNTTNRAAPGGDGSGRVGDSNAARSTGSNSVQLTGSSSTWYGITIALAPYVPPSGGSPMLFGGGVTIA